MTPCPLKPEVWSGEPLQGWVIFFFPFSTLYILVLPPALSASYFLGWACTSPNRFGIHSSAWEKHGRKATLHFGLETGEGSEVRGGRTFLWTAVSVTRALRMWKEDWATSSSPEWVGFARGKEFLRVVTSEGKMKVKKRFYFSCADNIMQEPRLRELFTLLLCFVGFFVVRSRSFFPHHHTRCSSTDSVRSIRVAPHTSGVHSLCTQNVTSMSRSRLR